MLCARYDAGPAGVDSAEGGGATGGSRKRTQGPTRIRPGLPTRIPGTTRAAEGAACWPGRQRRTRAPRAVTVGVLASHSWGTALSSRPTASLTEQLGSWLVATTGQSIITLGSLLVAP